MVQEHLRLARGVKSASEIAFWTVELNKIKKQEAKPDG